MAKNPKGQTCGNCRYYRAAYTEDGRRTGSSCQRFPPTGPKRGVTPGDLYVYSTFDSNPLPDAWCGEWVPADPKTVTEGAVTLARLVILGDLTAARALADRLREDDTEAT